ncbi:hypothetical protein ACFL4G_09885 [Thermodesulfobacteriota bacterium]
MKSTNHSVLIVVSFLSLAVISGFGCENAEIKQPAQIPDIHSSTEFFPTIGVSGIFKAGPNKEGFRADAMKIKALRRTEGNTALEISIIGSDDPNTTSRVGCIVSPEFKILEIEASGFEQGEEMQLTYEVMAGQKEVTTELGTFICTGVKYPELGYTIYFSNGVDIGIVAIEHALEPGAEPVMVKIVEKS